MPERWQRQLHRLRTVEMPAGLRARIDDGPTSGPGTPSRSRLTAAIVALAVFAAAGLFAWLALAPVGDEPPPIGEATVSVVVTLTESGDPDHHPSGTLTVDDSTIDGAFGSFELCDEKGCTVSDVVMPEFDRFVPIPIGSELVVQTTASRVRASLGDSDTPFAEGIPLELVDGSGRLDGEPGQYGLVFTAHWEEQGFTMDVPISFPIELVQSAPTPEPTGSIQPEPTESRTPEPTATASPKPAWAQVETELPGVGPVCGATFVEGTFLARDVVTRAWVYEPRPRGGCDGPNEEPQRLGVEDGSGESVVVSVALPVCFEGERCWAYSAPDLEGDGIDEIAVGTSTSYENAVFFTLYRVADCGDGESCPARLETFEIAEPGDPHEGFSPGQSLFRMGGPPFDVAGVVCRELDGGPALVFWFTASWDQWMVIDGPMLELAIGPDGPYIPDEEQVLDDLCGAPVFAPPT